MHFVLVHGWGFNASLWSGLVPRLANAKVSLVDLGFVAGCPEASRDWPGDAIDQDIIAIGHSLGVLWLLKERGGRFKGLVSVQGFDRYCPHVPSARVAALQRGLARDPGGTLQAFWRACGASDFASPEALNVARLAEGLDWLMHWDAQNAKKSLRCPILTLGARDDVIVPPTMSEAVWGAETMLWSPDGGHALPLRHPDWCARHVLEFAHSLPS
jgi:pimeloyl-[acyl-carrier protein] methyl ester esterase